jgi:hypothetical protein
MTRLELVGLQFAMESDAHETDAGKVWRNDHLQLKTGGMTGQKARSSLVTTGLGRPLGVTEAAVLSGNPC